jgi:hypothetical protein
MDGNSFQSEQQQAFSEFIRRSPLPKGNLANCLKKTVPLNSAVCK